MGMLVAWDAGGTIVATLDFMAARNDRGEASGIVDFSAYDGGQMLDIWRVDRAAGSGHWPEWLGSQIIGWRAEHGAGRVNALVHPGGHRRERTSLDDAIATAPLIGEARDLRGIVGGPNAPLRLDEAGRTVGRAVPPRGTPDHLPVIGRR